MAKKNRSSKATTAPKGRPTPRRGESGGRRVIGPTLQWFLVILAIVVVSVGLWVALDGGDFGDDPLQPGGFDGVSGAGLVSPEPT